MIVLFWNDVFVAVAVVFAKTPYTLLSHIQRLLFERSEQLKGFKYIIIWYSTIRRQLFLSLHLFGMTLGIRRSGMFKRVQWCLLNCGKLYYGINSLETIEVYK